VQPSAEAEFAKLNLPSLFCQAYFAKPEIGEIEQPDLTPCTGMTSPAQQV
jgi:hypothetical protein